MLYNHTGDKLKCINESKVIKMIVRWAYYHFKGHIFNISGNCTVHISPREALSDDYKVIKLYVTCHL